MATIDENTILNYVGTVVAVMTAFFLALAGLWYRIENLNSKTADVINKDFVLTIARTDADIDNTMARANAAFAGQELVAKQLNEFRFEVMKDYAQKALLKELEESILGHFDAVVSELRGIHKATLVMAAKRRNETKPKRRRAKP